MDGQGKELQLRQMSDFTQDSSIVDVIPASPKERDELLQAAKMSKGPLVVICRMPSTSSFPEGVYKKVQLVMRATSGAMWKTGLWHSYTRRPRGDPVSAVPS